jgi:hypothetical protein
MIRSQDSKDGILILLRKHRGSKPNRIHRIARSGLAENLSFLIPSQLRADGFAVCLGGADVAVLRLDKPFETLVGKFEE